MSKREANLFAAQGVDVDAPRAKRHKPAPATTSTPNTISEQAAGSNGVHNTAGETDNKTEDPETVKERGLKLWQTVKDATNKEGRVLSYDFLRLPSKRQYADYYDIIKHPIALDDIKRQLDSGQYIGFDQVRQDFEQCFKNAKEYNLRDSQIWKDAKYLHKFVIKESNKLTGTPDEPEGADDADGADMAGSDAEGDAEKKKKGPNMNRLLKSRLQKLVTKADDTGRMLSSKFMELPNKKQWSSYYKIIKHPQCFENIFKHLKRKEYKTSLEFANDVELVFSNALEFNQEQTPIWNDAIVLRDYFRQLMSDMPAPYSIPAYASSDHSTKIKLKVPIMIQHNGPSGTRGPALVTDSPRPNARATSNTSMLDVHTSAFQVNTVASRNPILSPAVAITPLSPPPAGPSTAPQPTFGVYPPQYPNTGYERPTAHASAIPPPVQIPPRQYQPTGSIQPPYTTEIIQDKSVSPIPDLSNRRRLRYVSIVTRPIGRVLNMASVDGVNTWAVRLDWQETSIVIADIKFLQSSEEVEESSDEEEHSRQVKVTVDEREDEEDEEEAQSQLHKGKRPRGRPRKKARAKTAESGISAGKGKAVARPTQVVEDVRVRLNGATITPDEAKEGTWNVDLDVGSNLVEVGELNGHIWRMYVERVAHN